MPRPAASGDGNGADTPKKSASGDGIGSSMPKLSDPGDGMGTSVLKPSASGNGIGPTTFRTPDSGVNMGTSMLKLSAPADGMGPSMPKPPASGDGIGTGTPRASTSGDGTGASGDTIAPHAAARRRERREAVLNIVCVGLDELARAKRRGRGRGLGGLCTARTTSKSGGAARCADHERGSGAARARGAEGRAVAFGGDLGCRSSPEAPSGLGRVLSCGSTRRLCELRVGSQACLLVCVCCKNLRGCA